MIGIKPRGAVVAAGGASLHHHRQLDQQTIDLAYAHWRRRLEEEFFLFNVAADNAHRCDTDSGRDIVALDGAARRLFGCTHCGRFHHCTADAERCPLARAPDGDHYVCLFSGRVLTHGEEAAVPGTYHLEIAQRQAPRITNSALPWAHTTSARSYHHQANVFSSPTARNAAWAKGDAARELRSGLFDMRAKEAEARRAERLAHEAVHGPLSRKRSLVTTASTPTGPASKRSKPTGDNNNNTAVGSWDASDDVPGDDRELPSAAEGLDASRPTAFPAEETLRDATFQESFFAPLANVWQELVKERPVVVHERQPSPRAVAPTLLEQGAKASGPSPVSPVRLANDSLQHVQRIVRQLVAALHVVCPARDGHSAAYHAEGYLALLRNVLPWLLPPAMLSPTKEEKKESGEDDTASRANAVTIVGDPSPYLVAFLANLLSTDARAVDSYGNLVLVWRADPWLAECSAEGAFDQLADRIRKACTVSQATPPVATVAMTPRTVGFRITAEALLNGIVGRTATRKKKARSLGKPTAHAQTRTQDAAVEGLSDHLRHVLLTKPHATSHLTARMRASLDALCLAPLALHTLVHTGEVL